MHIKLGEKAYANASQSGKIIVAGTRSVKENKHYSFLIKKEIDRALTANVKEGS